MVAGLLPSVQWKFKVMLFLASRVALNVNRFQPFSGPGNSVISMIGENVSRRTGLPGKG
ncbi:MAG: hypothetical protein R2724_19290 [Bryobacterales bacterium]